MNLSRKLYKAPKLRDCGGDLSQRWLVFYHLYEGGKWVRYRIYIPTTFKTRIERYTEAERLIKQITSKLQKGHPINTQFKEERTNLSTILTRALEYKLKFVTYRTAQGYSHIAGMFQKWLTKNKLDNIAPEDFSQYHLAKFVDESIIKRDIGAKTINGYLSYLKALFVRMREIAPIAFEVKYKKMIETPPEIEVWTPDQKTKLANHLKKHDPQLFLVVLFVYHCFLRPAEILKLKIKDFDFDKNLIKVPAGIAKNNKTMYVTLSEQLIEKVQYLRGLNPNLHVFSTDLKPGTLALCRTSVTKKFRAECIKIGLPKTLKLYHFKHTGNSEMLQKGVNIRELQLQNRHSDISITERYLYRLGSTPNVAFRNANKL